MSSLREQIDNRACPGFYENIFTRKDQRRELFRSNAHGLIASLAPKQVTPGHTLITPKLCVPRVDLMPARELGKLQYVSQAVGVWLMANLDVTDIDTEGRTKPISVAEAVAGDAVAHAHVHRGPVYERGDWFKGFPLGNHVTLDNGQLDQIHEQVRFPDDMTAMIEAQLELPADDRIAPVEIADAFRQIT